MAAVAERTRPTALPLQWRQSTAGEYFAEAFGCFILISLGDGVVAMLWALIGSGRSSAGALQSSGDWLLITWGWFLAVMLAVYTVGGITGAHINPAITVGQALCGLGFQGAVSLDSDGLCGDSGKPATMSHHGLNPDPAAPLYPPTMPRTPPPRVRAARIRTVRSARLPCARCRRQSG